MRFFQLFFPVNVRRQLAQRATEIARRSEPAVAAALVGRVSEMRMIENEIEELSASVPAIGHAPRGPLVEEALERLIVWVIAASVKKTPPVSVPRRAA
jgi:hypothetical protein